MTLVSRAPEACMPQYVSQIEVTLKCFRKYFANCANVFVCVCVDFDNQIQYSNNSVNVKWCQNRISEKKPHSRGNETERSWGNGWGRARNGRYGNNFENQKIKEKKL